MSSSNEETKRPLILRQTRSRHTTEQFGPHRVLAENTARYLCQPGPMELELAGHRFLLVHGCYLSCVWCVTKMTHQRASR